MRYDLVVIGSDPMGRQGAIAAARLNQRVALVERADAAHQDGSLSGGNACYRTLREAAVRLIEARRRRLAYERPREQSRITMQDLQREVAVVVEQERVLAKTHLDRAGVDLLRGTARFTSPHDLIIENDQGSLAVAADRVLLACQSRPVRPSQVPFDGERIVDAGELLRLDAFPRSLIVVGAGVTGLKHAILLATLGVRVVVVDGAEPLLDFCDREIVDALLFQARSLGMAFRLGEDAIAVEHAAGNRVAVELESGRRLLGDCVLYAAGRRGDTETLDLQSAGLKVDERGRLWCDDNQQTWVPHIYGAGDVVGFPAQAAITADQGLRAVCHALGRPVPADRHPAVGLSTIPEIAMVGKTESQLTTARVPYEVGVARAREGALGLIPSDSPGLLKILFHRSTRRLLGVHIIGESASEMIRIGQSVLARDGTIDSFCDPEFDDSTMAEQYTVAAIDGLSKLGHDVSIPGPAALQEFESAHVVPDRSAKAEYVGV